MCKIIYISFKIVCDMCIMELLSKQYSVCSNIILIFHIVKKKEEKKKDAK